MIPAAAAPNGATRPAGAKQAARNDGPDQAASSGVQGSSGRRRPSGRAVYRAVAVVAGGVAAAALGGPYNTGGGSGDRHEQHFAISCFVDMQTHDPGCRCTEWSDSASGCKTGSRK